MNRTGARVAAILVAVLMVGATACGGSSSSKDDESSNDGAVTATVESDTSSSDSSTGSSDTSSDDLSDMMDGLGGDCMQAGLAYFALSMSALGASFGMSEADLAEMQSSIGELKAEIPSEIKGDFEVYADALEEFANAMQGMDMADIMSGSSQAEEAGKVLETPEVKQAQENLDAYFEKECSASSGGS